MVTLIPGIARLIANIAAAVIWAHLSLGSLDNIRGPHASLWGLLIDIELLARNCSLTALFLLRRPARIASRGLKEWFVALTGTFLGLFYVRQGTYALVAGDFQGILYLVMACALLMGITAIISLGYSFGIVPANRGIKTNGLYRFVRHPLYSFYIVADVCLVSLMFSWMNVAVLAGFISSCYLRAFYEEKLLLRDPAYREYSVNTRYMFIPGLL